MKRFPLLIVTGTIASGKTRVALEMHRILVDHAVPHAYVDCDALFSSWQPGGPYNEELKLKNLAAVWANFESYGVERLLLSEVIESADYLRPYREVLPDADLQVCRLTAPLPVREARLRSRDSGDSLEWHLARTVALEKIMVEASVGDVVIENEGKAPDAVAREVLIATGWAPSRLVVAPE